MLKKAAVSLITLVIAVVLLSSLTIGVTSTLSTETREITKTEMNNTAQNYQQKTNKYINKMNNPGYVPPSGSGTGGGPSNPDDSGGSFVCYHPRSIVKHASLTYTGDVYCQDCGVLLFTGEYAKVVTYNGNSGTFGQSSTNPVTYLQGKITIGSYKAPTKQGYSFVTWFKDAACTSGNSFDKDADTKNLTEDITVFAKWSINTYELLIDANGGVRASDNNSSVIKVVKSFGTQENISERTKTGYTLSGYTMKNTTTGTADSLGGAQFNFNSTAKTGVFTQGSEPITLVAQWTPNIYKVTLDNQGAANAGTTAYWYRYKTTSVVNNETIYYWTNAACTTPLTGYKITVPSKTGYTFGGYYEGVDGTGTQYVNAEGLCINNLYSVVANNITLYAKWIPNNVYKVTLDNQGATNAGTTAYWYRYKTTSVVNNETIYYWTNETCTTPLYSYKITIPTKAGYTFGGYYTGINGAGTQYVSAEGQCINNLYDVVASNTTLYAKWVVTPYTYTLNYNIAKTLDGDYIDTGYIPNWDEDFQISANINVDSIGNRYLIFGNYNASSSNAFNVEISANGALRFYIGTGSVDKASGTFKAGENVQVTFTWTASTDTYTLSAIGNTTNISFTGTKSMTGKGSNNLRIGTADHRGSMTTFSDIKINSFTIKNKYTIESPSIILPVVGNNSEFNTTHNFGGWIKGSSLITEIATGSYGDLNLMAQWNEKDKPVTEQPIFSNGEHHLITGWTPFTTSRWYGITPELTEYKGETVLDFYKWMTNEAYYGCATTEKVDVTNYSTLAFTVVDNSHGSELDTYLGVSSTNDDNTYEACTIISHGTLGTIEVDISDLIGEYYIKVNTKDTGGDSNFYFKVSSISLY